MSRSRLCRTLALAAALLLILYAAALLTLIGHEHTGAFCPDCMRAARGVQLVRLLCVCLSLGLCMIKNENCLLSILPQRAGRPDLLTPVSMQVRLNR